MEYITEEEAKGKWCPAARQLATSSSGGLCAMNRTGMHPGIEKVFMAPCIASDCMWWEWQDVYEFLPRSGETKPVEPKRGRCGMGR